MPLILRFSAPLRRVFQSVSLPFDESRHGSVQGRVNARVFLHDFLGGVIVGVLWVDREFLVAGRK